MKTIQSTLNPPVHSSQLHTFQRDTAFFDIETTGLSPKTSSLYLIGGMDYNPKTGLWQLTQWFADDQHSEAEILKAFLDYLSGFRRLCHFNGATFDIPYVLNKCEKHNLVPSPQCMTLLGGEGSLDLLKEIRPLKKRLHLLKANQTALEHWLEIFREDNYNGGELIPIYSEYMQKRILRKEGAEELEQLLLLHNHDDMAGMLEITSLLSYRQAFSLPAPPEILSVQWQESTLQVCFTLPTPVPKKIILHHPLPHPCISPASSQGKGDAPEITVTLEKEEGLLKLPVYQGSLKYFIPDYNNYYYLPLEDTAIHKSIAEFVDRKHRQKATAATCYTKREGHFIPSLSLKKHLDAFPAFYVSYKDKLPFYQLPEELQEQKALMAEYLCQLLSDI